MALVSVSAVLLASMAAAGTASAASCPNDAFRFGAGANLPDCRGYELVSPADTNSYDIDFGDQAVSAAGNAVAYQSKGAFANTPGGPVVNEYLGSRGPSGWSTIGVAPPQNPAFKGPETSLFEGFSADLSQSVSQSLFSAPLGGAKPNEFALFLRNSSASFQLLDPDEPPFSLFAPGLDGASSDFSHLVFTSVAVMPGTGAPDDGNFKLYEWTAPGTWSLVSVLPDGTPTDGAAGMVNPAAGWPHMVSADGSRVYWFTSPTTLYLRQNSQTVQIDAAQCQTNPNCSTSPSATWWTASTDGSVALFTSADQLTDNSTANGIKSDLYAYNANTGQLQDLTPAHNGADVKGVIGTSADASYIYFVANGVLAPGASAGHCGTNQQSSGCNLYVWHNGTTTYVTHVISADWAGTAAQFDAFTLSESAQVSADGQHLLLTSAAPLTSFNNNGHKEIYRYDATTAQLNCVSCDPTGTTPTADAVLSAPADIGFSQQTSALNPINNMSTDGRVVFFETSNSLLSQAAPGVDNVYEWKAQGAGTCTTAGGCLDLISSGQSPGAHFLDATPTGDDVFFLTQQSLTGFTSGLNVSVYDARVGGGFPPPIVSTTCAGDNDGCRGVATAGPGAPIAASVTFIGPGNVPGGAVKAAFAARVRILSKIVHGSMFLLRVQVPRRGVVSIGGPSIRPFRRVIHRPGTYTFALTLTKNAKTQLAHRHKLHVPLRVRYAPAHARKSTATFTVTVEPSSKKGRGR
jgi:hypothetical protein